MKFVKDFVVPVVVLTVICVVVSTALVFTYQATKPIIDEAKMRRPTQPGRLCYPALLILKR